ncbi:RNA polymerase sigma factor [Kineosporia babensis]|uniref:RNA polymerase sigma factor n=1 Tax=Kineosporia babensis TaxID=499548 RepID=A0A9X1SXJ0_9ACTN|nr:RNA polymerase sigma factor [Kineosporia babensis]
MKDEAFRRLYTTHFTAILNYAQRRVSTPDDAADLVAETFLVAWRRRAEIPPGGEARLWLFGVARLVLANHTRGEQRRVRLGERLRLDLREGLEDPAVDLVEALAVDAALSALDDTDREVLELTVWEQLSPREIGALLDLPARVVRSRLFRARTRMRGRFDSGNLTNDRAGAGHVPDVRTALTPRKERKA